MTDFTEDSTFLFELKHPVPDNPVMFLGWSGCMNWASRKPEIMESYKQTQGLESFDPNSRSDMLKFCDWATEMIWGDPDTTIEE